MKPDTSKRLLVASFLIGAVAVAASATAQTSKGPDSGKSKRAHADFVRGSANTKKARVVQPRTEKEAIATRRQVEPGIIEMQLPEDRMVDLVGVRQADGSLRYEHLAEGQALPPAKDSQGEAK